jgi:hypothetical protein
MSALEACPGCGALLPPFDGPTHRYIGASPACWAIYTALHNGGDPPLAPDPSVGLLVDAYAAQHPGVPSDQSIQSVAIHVLTLFGVLHQGIDPANALWVRLRALRDGRSPRHARFRWLEPPRFAGGQTVADVVQPATPLARTQVLRHYVRDVLDRWMGAHEAIIRTWYDQYILADRI